VRLHRPAVVADADSCSRSCRGGLVPAGSASCTTGLRPTDRLRSLLSGAAEPNSLAEFVQLDSDFDFRRLEIVVGVVLDAVAGVERAAAVGAALADALLLLQVVVPEVLLK